MVFGDVAVETDQPSLPMLSGAGSRTWVEHTLPLTGAASLAVAGGDADASTDLAAGSSSPAASASSSPGGARTSARAAGGARRAGTPGTGPHDRRPPRAGRRAPLDVHDPDVTLPPPASAALLEATSASSRALVEAKVCGRGHVNPPTSAMCAVCGAPLRPGSDANVHVTRPSLGRLQLDDGDSSSSTTTC